MQNLHPTIAAALAPFAGIFGQPEAPRETAQQRHRRLRSEAAARARALNWQAIGAARAGDHGAAKGLRMRRDGIVAIARRFGKSEG